MGIEKLRKLLESTNIDDIRLGLEYLSEMPRRKIIKIIRTINNGKNHSYEGEPDCTYCLENNSKNGVNDVYYMKKYYYYEINSARIYIDSPGRALKRIKEGHSKLQL